MISDSKFVEIAKGLLAKTRQHKAAWREVDENSFLLPLKRAAISLRYDSPPTEADSIILTLHNDEDRAAARWVVYEGQPHWPLIAELYSLLQNQVTRVDRVLEEVES